MEGEKYAQAERNLRSAIDYLLTTIGSTRDMSNQDDRDQVLRLSDDLARAIRALEALEKAQGRGL